MRKCAGIILGLAMVFAFLPMTGFAAEQGADEQTQWGPVLDEVYEQLGGVDITSAQPGEERVEAGQAEDSAQPDSASDQDKGVGADKGASDIDACDYTYEITPLLEPFNHYFFVKTENPDPKTFRFVDKSSAYSDNSMISQSSSLFADIKYDDEATGRVNGGYIFYSGDTDGGSITLQRVEYPGTWYATWYDTDTTFTLPKLKDNVDYLVDTFATKGSFFENMDAVQSGFDKICLYSGSFIRGEVVRKYEYWSMGTGHADQGLYIYSPFSRQDSISLFASAVYPFRYDSLGFPGMMGAVSQRLDSSSTYTWDSYSHAYIHVTYNGETKAYGGQGNGKGQGISEDKILRYFTFGSGGTQIDLDGIHSLLLQYGKIEMDDDIPHDDALTWEQIYDTVGDGAWGRIGTDQYIYIYQDGPGNDFTADEWGVGNSLYWWGDLGYAQDCWVDGRYVTTSKIWKKGIKFSAKPTADIILSEFTVPQITYSTKYEKNPDTGAYEYVYTVESITEETKRVRFSYQDGVWTPNSSAFNSRCADYNKISAMVKQGKLDQKYLDMVTLTEDEVLALQVDRNTSVPPSKGFFYDGNYPAGTPFDESIGHYWGDPKTVTKPGCETPGQQVTACLICGTEVTEEIPATGHTWGSSVTLTKPGCETPGKNVRNCQKCGAQETEEIPPTGHQWGEVAYSITKSYSKIRATRTCINDPSHVETETKETTQIISKEATCETPGEMIYRAVFDNPVFKSAQKKVEIPALGHNWGEGVVTQYPTADADGVRSFTCGNCGKVRTEPIPKDVDEITPSDAMADEAAVEESIPVVNTAKIKTTGNITKKQMKIKFPADASIDNYRIQYRLAGQTEWNNAWSAGENTYVIQGLKKSSLCEFRIAGFVKQDNGRWARGEWSKIAYRYMNAVPAKTITAGKGSLTFTWAKDKKATGYQVQYSLKKNMAGAKTKKVTGASKRKLTIKKLNTGKKYYVKVRPIKKSEKTYIGILSKGLAVKVK